MAFKYDSPAEWLMIAAKEWDTIKLYNAIGCLVDHIDSDKIQDIFQQEMDEDGYFDEICKRCNDTGRVEDPELLESMYMTDDCMMPCPECEGG